MSWINNMPELPHTGFTSFSYWHNQQIHTSKKLNFSLTKILSIQKITHRTTANYLRVNSCSPGEHRPLLAATAIKLQILFLTLSSQHYFAYIRSSFRGFWNNSTNCWPRISKYFIWSRNKQPTAVCNGQFKHPLEV